MLLPLLHLFIKENVQNQEKWQRISYKPITVQFHHTNCTKFRLKGFSIIVMETYIFARFEMKLQQHCESNKFLSLNEGVFKY